MVFDGRRRGIGFITREGVLRASEDVSRETCFCCDRLSNANPRTENALLLHYTRDRMSKISLEKGPELGKMDGWMDRWTDGRMLGF